MKSKVVIIDSDHRSRKLISSILKDFYDIVSAQSFSEGYSVIVGNHPDIIIIDPLFPEKEGAELIKKVREWNDCQIIVVSASTTERAVIDAFGAGADDFVRKPFFSSELRARVDVLSARYSALEKAKGANTEHSYIFGSLSLQYDNHRVTVDGAPIHLTKNEFKILSLLCRHSGKVLTYEYIIKSIWGPRADTNTGILRVNIANLRKKIEKDQLSPQYILTENGIGYSVNESEFKDSL